MGNRLGVVFLILFLSNSAFGWHVDTHLQMTRDAISLMPPDLQKALTDHQRFVEAGIKDPDELLRDWQNHYYIPGPEPEGGAIDRIEKLIQIIQSKFQTSSTMDVSKQLCYLAHYIADLWNPEYLIKQNTAPDMTFVKDSNLVVYYEGYTSPIEDFREYFTRRAEWRWRLENSKQISTLLYNEAVNDIARSWLTLWQQSGKTVEPQNTALIDHKQGALSANYQQLLTEEKVTWNLWSTTPGDALAKVIAHQAEIERLSEEVSPSDSALAARAQIRNQQENLAKINPQAPFIMLETSLKAIGDQQYLIARVRNKSEGEIASLSFMVPGVKGPVAQIVNLKPQEVVKIESTIPAGVAKEQIQVIFASIE